jgi:hypothetical protein
MNVSQHHSRVDSEEGGHETVDHDHDVQSPKGERCYTLTQFAASFPAAGCRQARRVLTAKLTAIRTNVRGPRWTEGLMKRRNTLRLWTTVDPGEQPIVNPVYAIKARSQHPRLNRLHGRRQRWHALTPLMSFPNATIAKFAEGRRPTWP